MTSLIRELEALRAKMADQHGDEFTKVVELNARIENQDEQLISELNGVIAAHETRRAEVHRLARLLAARVGALPPPAQRPVPLPAQQYQDMSLPAVVARARRETDEMERVFN
jgi:uncharacterized coiled-coil protein SlyX